MSSRTGAATAALCALVLGGALGVGCGSSGGTASTATAPFITGVTTPAYLRTSTGPYETTVEGTATMIKTDAQGNPIPKRPAGTSTAAAGGGDEEGIRVPADFTVRADTLSPKTVTVPPALPVALRVTSGDGKPHTLVFAAKPSTTLSVPATGSASARLPGQRKGTVTVTIDGGAPTVALLVADDAGP